MRKIYLIVFPLVLLIHPVFSQPKNFLEKYDKFRFSLYSKLNSLDDLHITNEIKTDINNFLNKYSKEIIVYRTSQLEKYEREAPNNPKSYKPIDEQFLTQARNSAIYLYPLNVNSGEAVPEDTAGMGGALSLIDLISVDPISVVVNTSSQLTIMVLNQKLGMTNDEISKFYQRIAIGGYYISATQQGKNNWDIEVNAFDFKFLYACNTQTGHITLTDIYLLTE